MLSSSKVYYIYLFREKKTGKVIYVGSSARPMQRIKEHIQCAEFRKKTRNNNHQKIYLYLRDNNLELIKDVEIVWVERVEDKEESLRLEAEYFYKYKDTVLNDRPAEDMNGNNNPRRRKIICVNTGEIFGSISECAKFYNKARSTISNVVLGEKPHTLINDEKYYFEYYNGTCNDQPKGVHSSEWKQGTLIKELL